MLRWVYEEEAGSTQAGEFWGGLAGCNQGSGSLRGASCSTAERNFPAQRRFLDLQVVFPPPVCSMLELHLAVLLGEFLCSSAG